MPTRAVTGRLVADAVPLPSEQRRVRARLRRGAGRARRPRAPRRRDPHARCRQHHLARRSRPRAPARSAMPETRTPDAHDARVRRRSGPSAAPASGSRGASGPDAGCGGSTSWRWCCSSPWSAPASGWCSSRPRCRSRRSRSRATTCSRSSACRKIAAVPEGEQLVFVDLADAARRVETLSEVKDADVTRAWPDGVLITVTERTAVAVVELGGKIRGLDAEGIVFRDYKTAPPGLPRVRPTHLGRHRRPQGGGRRRRGAARRPRRPRRPRRGADHRPDHPACCATVARCAGGVRTRAT